MAHWQFSNFWPIEGGICGYDADDTNRYLTLEHAYQAAKTVDPSWRTAIAQAPTPARAKRLGRRAPLRTEWHRDINGEPFPRVVMRTLLRHKFRVEPHRSTLLRSEGELSEWNRWHDVVWGRCICAKHGSSGANWLGKLLMERRTYLQTEVVDASGATELVAHHLTTVGETCHASTRVIGTRTGTTESP